MIAAVWQGFNLVAWPSEWVSLVAYIPFVLFLLVATICIWFNRIQTFAILILIVAFNFFLYFYAPVQQSTVNHALLFALLGLLAPINLLLWTLLPEKGVKNRPIMLFIMGVFTFEWLCIHWVMVWLPSSVLTIINYSLWPELKWIQINMLPLFSVLLVGLVLSLRLHFLKSVKLLDHAVLFVLVLIALATFFPQNPAMFAWLSSVSLLIVLLALMVDMQHLAYADELTGIPARRALMEAFLSLGKTYSLAMVDIDHFKNFNDTYGHTTGDKVLKLVAKALASVQGGKAYRYGGEEFVVVFRGKHTEEVKSEMERLRQLVEQTVFNVPISSKKTVKQAKKSFFTQLKKQSGFPSRQKNVTISIGLAQANKQASSPQTVLEKADKALYKAKKLGRNKMVF